MRSAFTISELSPTDDGDHVLGGCGGSGAPCPAGVIVNTGRYPDGAPVVPQTLHSTPTWPSNPSPR